MITEEAWSKKINLSLWVQPSSFQIFNHWNRKRCFPHHHHITDQQQNGLKSFFSDTVNVQLLFFPLSSHTVYAFMLKVHPRCHWQDLVWIRKKHQYATRLEHLTHILPSFITGHNVLLPRIICSQIEMVASSFRSGLSCLSSRQHTTPGWTGNKHTPTV